MKSNNTAKLSLITNSYDLASAGNLTQKFGGLKTMSKMNSRNKKQMFAPSPKYAGSEKAEKDLEVSLMRPQQLTLQSGPASGRIYNKRSFTPGGNSNKTFQRLQQSFFSPKSQPNSRFSQSPFSTSINATFEPSVQAMTKIALNLERLADDLDADKSFDCYYREKLTPAANTREPLGSAFSYLERIEEHGQEREVVLQQPASLAARNSHVRQAEQLSRKTVKQAINILEQRVQDEDLRR